MKSMSSKLSKFVLSSLVLASMGIFGATQANASHIHVNNGTKARTVRVKKNLPQASMVGNATKNTNNNINSNNTQDKNFNKVNKIAKSKLGDRYVWGATGPHKFDCSGFTQYVYKHASHISLPRTAGAQKAYCKRVSEKHVKAGDLAFFGYGHNVEHVGLCVGKGNMIDAQNRGVITEHIHAPWWHLLGYGRIPATR